MNVTVYIVDSFIAKGKGGNPAGVVLDAAGLSAKQMQAIAKQVGLSETAFVLPSSHATHEVRFFTPVNEVDLCGHATIGTWAVLHQKGYIEPGNYTQQTRAGLLKINIEPSGVVSMEQAKASFGPLVPREDVAKILNLDITAFADYLPQIVSTGIATLVVGLVDKSALLNLQPDLEGIKAMETKYGFMLTHPFVLLAAGDSLATGRDFGPSLGITEESATGTANGALLAYLNHHGIVKQNQKCRFEQGESMGKLSYLYGEIVEATVWVGGQAKLVKEETVNQQ